MKCKVIFGMLAAALIAATSCESNLETSADGTSTVTLNVGAPVIATRAYSDGTTATELQYAVYSVGKNDVLTKLDLDGRKTFSLSTNVDLQLTTGQTYAVVFWAASPEAPYSVAFNKDGAEMTVDYAEAVCNDENRDAFYKYEKFTVTGTMALDVKLTRPFAQLNIGTNDFEASAAAGYTVTQSSVTVPVYTSLDLVSGDVETAAEQTFALADLPEGETFPVKGYEYLSMNYLLVPADKEVVDVTFSYTDGNVEKTRVVGSVPVQRNYRTNIYGQLLTSDVDINVEVEPDYETPDLPSEFEEALAIAAQVGGTVTLTEDLTLTEPIVIFGLKTKAAAAVALTLDLNGHTLSYTSDVAASSAMVTVNSGNKLVVKDSKGSGKLSYEYTGAGDPNFGWGSYTIANNGTLVVESGRIEMVCQLNGAQGVSHMYCAIHQGGGSTVINGGTIACETYRSIRVNRGTLVINGGELVGQVWMHPFSGDTSLTINGGEFAPAGPDMSSVYVENSNYVVALDVKGGTFATKIGCASPAKEGTKGSVSAGTFTDATGMSADLIAEGNKLVQTGAGYVVVSETIDAVVGTTQELNEALTTGGEILLTQDVASNATMKNDAVINLNGNTFEATGTINLGNNADLTMTGGDYVVNGTYGHVDVRPSTAEGSVVVYEDVNFSFNKLNKTFGPSTNRLGTVVEVCATAAGAKTTIKFKNCTFDNAQVLFEGLSGTTGKIEAVFEGCTFNALTSSAPIYVQNYVEGTILVKDCTFNLECTSGSASAVSISSSSSTVVTLTAENNTLNAEVAVPYTYDPSKGETEENTVKVNGTPTNINLVSYKGTVSTINVTGTVVSGIAVN